MGNGISSQKQRGPVGHNTPDPPDTKIAGIQENPLRIVLVGKTGHGKSATANTILGRKAFESKLSAHAVTKRCQRASHVWKGRTLLVVDTPGLFDTKERLMTTCKEISRCVLLSHPGPHAIILVVQLGRYLKEEQKTVALIKAIFGERAMRYMVIVFTRKEDLHHKSLSDFTAEADVDLQNIVKECGSRCCAFNNSSADEAEKEAQVQELVELIDKMVQENGGAHFSDAIYKGIEEKLNHQEQAFSIIYADQLEKATKMAGLPDNTLRIVLVGKTGHGKSATANTILGRDEFESKVSAHAVTKSCQRAERVWKGRKLLVVDTPGLFDTKETLMTTCKEISLCVLFSRPGPHAIILVLPLGRYTEEEQKTVALIKAIFGERAMRYMVIVFTRKEELEGRTLSDFTAEADVDLQNIVKECGSRCCAFNNNSADEAEKEAQVQELVELIDKTVQDNGGVHFSDAIYKGLEENLKHRAEVLRMIYADQLEKETKMVEEEYAGGNISREEMEKNKERIKMKYQKLIKNIREETERNIFDYVIQSILKTLSNIWHTFWK